MLKIKEMFAFVAKERKGEGVMASEMVIDGRLMFVPLVGADIARVDSLRRKADEISRITGKPYKILHFKLVGEIPRR